MEHESNGDTNCNWCTLNNHQKFRRKARGVGNWRTSLDYTDCNIVEVGQNTEKSSGDLRKLAVTKTPVKDHQLILA